MTTEETQVPTAPETQNPAPEAVQQPEVTDQDSTASEGQEAADTDKAEKTPEQKELERLRRQLTKAQRINGKLSAEAERAREVLSRFEQTHQPESTPEVDPVQLAREIATIERVAEKSNAIADKGTAAFGKEAFGQAVAAIVEEAGPLFDQKGKPTSIGEAILDADEPEKLIKFLGDNPELASELQGLSPLQLGRRIERFEQQMKAKPKPVSRAPDPARPINAQRGPQNLADADMDTYVAMRKAQGARWAR